ncbi:MAG TPA: hypothetical protein VGQ00_04610 [Candidatus Norongarragalinales archaeon]|jgi:hypothetical protein|nr:hypothetical protein [Candidatus Norongarragalinales archaeon]
MATSKHVTIHVYALAENENAALKKGLELRESIDPKLSVKMFAAPTIKAIDTMLTMARGFNSVQNAATTSPAKMRAREFLRHDSIPSFRGHALRLAMRAQKKSTKPLHLVYIVKPEMVEELVQHFTGKPMQAHGTRVNELEKLLIVIPPEGNLRVKFRTKNYRAPRSIFEYIKKT